MTLPTSAAVLRSLAFLEGHAELEFGARARDYMLGVTRIGSGFADADVRAKAASVGSTFGARWLRLLENSTQPFELEPTELRLQMGDAFNAKRLGVTVPEAHLAALREVAASTGFVGFFGFDPRVAPPPLPGADALHHSRWDVWQHALILGFVCERLDADCGASYFDVLKWLPHLKQLEPLRPPPTFGGGNGDEWRLYASQLSALTHVVYTLSDYAHLTLDGALLPEEVGFLHRALEVSVRQLKLPEAVGEVADCLKNFGVHEGNSAVMAESTAFLVGAQNADGSWGLPIERTVGTIYHSTIVAAWGLRDAALPHRRGPVFPELVPVLTQWAAAAGEGAVVARSLLLARLQSPEMQAMLKDPKVVANLKKMMEGGGSLQEASRMMRDPTALWAALQQVAQPDELRERILETSSGPSRQPDGADRGHQLGGAPRPPADGTATSPQHMRRLDTGSGASKDEL